MIETYIREYLIKTLDFPIYLQESFDNPIKDDKYVRFEKISSSKENRLTSSTFAFQSYGQNLEEASKLSNLLIEKLEEMIILDRISKVEINGEYNFPDEIRKKHRYQAVVIIYHY